MTPAKFKHKVKKRQVTAPPILLNYSLLEAVIA